MPGGSLCPPAIHGACCVCGVHREGRVAGRVQASTEVVRSAAQEAHHPAQHPQPAHSRGGSSAGA